MCVRYKYDKSARNRYVTVELIDEESDWLNEPEPALNSHHERRMGVRVAYTETEIREKVKTAGGIWRPRQKLWELRYADIVALGLESRVVPGDETASRYDLDTQNLPHVYTEFQRQTRVYPRFLVAYGLQSGAN